MTDINQLLKDLVIANRILAREDVVDAYGHVSVRHPDKPEHFFLSRSLAPDLIETDDIVELGLDGQPVRDETRPLYLERFIHAAIFEARPDVHAVVHAHAEDILPFGIAQATPLRPVIHSGSFIGAHVPVWDIADEFGDTDLLVRNMDSRPRPRALPRRQQRRADARARLRLGGALADRGGADLGLPAAQCAGAVSRHAARRRDQAAERGRDRGACRRLQPLFAGDLAGVAILGHQGRLRPHDHEAGREARA